MIKSVKKFLIHILDFYRHKKSYAQDGEDTALAAFYEGKKNYKGFFVDIGAHHPVRFSNTFMFYKQGWKGINIDPTPGSMTWFRRMRSRDVNLEIGVGNTRGNLNFYCFNEPALNTFDEPLAKARNVGVPYHITKTIAVPIEPLADILDKNLPAGQKIDFFSIDVEGLDLQVLMSNNWEKYKPEFILVEDPDFRLTKADSSEIYKFMTTKNYEMVASLKRTVIYKKC